MILLKTFKKIFFNYLKKKPKTNNISGAMHLQRNPNNYQHMTTFNIQYTIICS